MYNFLKIRSTPSFSFFLSKKEAFATVCVENSTLTVQARILSATYVLSLTEHTTDELYYQVQQLLDSRTLQTGRFYIFYNEKPLLKGRSLMDYNFHNYGSIHVEFPNLIGGSPDSSNRQFVRAYSHILHCEKQVMQATLPIKHIMYGKKPKTGLRELLIPNWKDITKPDIDDDVYLDYLRSKGFKVQACDAETAQDRQDKSIRQMLKIVIARLRDMPPIGYDADWFIKQLENFVILKTFAPKCKDFNDYLELTKVAYRLFTGEVFTKKIQILMDKYVFGNVQSLEVGETLSMMRSIFDGVTNLQECELAKKLVSLYSYLLTLGYLKQFGIELNDEDYSKVEQRALLSAFSSKKSFYVCVLDTVLFICERLHEFKETGEISSFVQSRGKYSKWLKEADRILNLAPFVGNLSAHGTSYFSFIADLRDLCEKGEAYAKYLRGTSGVESTMIVRKLNSLKLLQNTEITRRAAMQERAQPMGVLVTGHSSIAKSSFTKMLFNYYGALFDLERGDDFRYVRNPTEEFWSNFDSSKWCLQLDDIAFRNPAKCNDIDKTLQDLLNVVNNVPYVPPQASLEDKGRTPVLAELVIATSNCETLNAQEYFWCPLAVRRRLPYVVSLTPKNEFLHENQCFIDPVKIKSENGKFADLWEITVKEIVPELSFGRENASLRVVQTFNDVNEFLRHFGAACKQHKENQARAMKKDVDMLTIQVCKTCLSPTTHCTCANIPNEVQSNEYLWYAGYLSLTVFINWMITYWMFWRIIDYMASTKLLRSLAFRVVNRIKNSEKVLDFYGRYIENKRSGKLRNMCLAIGILSTAFSMYAMYASQKSTNQTEVKVESSIPTLNDSEEEEVIITIDGKKHKGKKYHIIANCSPADEISEAKVQGNKYGTVEDQLVREERSNVWYNPTVEMTTFDVPAASASLNNITPEKLYQVFGRNCVLLRAKLKGNAFIREQRGIFIKGHMCVANAHLFREHAADTLYELTIVQTNMCEGINSNIKIEINTNNIVFSQTTDLCLFQVDSIPPFKDITKFWQTNYITPSSCVELVRNHDGSLERRNLYGLTFAGNVPVNEMNNRTFNIYYGQSDQITEVGLCGSMCVAVTPRGPIIIGFHFLGQQYSVGILRINLEEINVLASSHKIPQRPVVQSGDQPEFECANRKHTLGPIHHKSLVRYIEQGTVNVYGSFEGFRPKPKSKVCATPLQKEFLQHYNTEVGYDKPAMSGWEPWRKNVVEMVKPNVTHNKQILADCVKAFTNDIINGLPNEWEKDLIFLSDEAAVNGLPGVIYIDGINRNSSMGFPWCKSKSGFLYEKKTEKYPDGVDFLPEVWHKVRNIEEKYARGERANPVFTGHLKDEATAKAKCAVKKTRLFTGAPIDWSLVVRKKLLTFVRLVQKNKFVFEAGPGVVCQSDEWGKVYRYLTQFGEDQMVAGDYGKFDKRMIADFVLAAFEVITNLYRAAGFSEDELLTIMCIGEDTAFPLCNINGDLMEFFGTNPSGHPLTVIINSLVNALYMRYCYATLNPNGEVVSFKKNVSLFTYGDDNVFGVDKSIPWFNHTTIQNVLKSIGVEYTMADKTSESRPYINIKEVSFLKREWVFNEEIGDYLCPLDEESLIKSLTVWVPSGTIDQFKQMVCVMTSANNEYFFYGREKFNKEHAFLQGLLQQEPYCYYADDKTLPSFDELAERWRRASCSDVLSDINFPWIKPTMDELE